MAVGDIKVLKENASASYDETVLNTESLITSKMTNPMTKAGDIIYGGTSGTPTRLAKGTAGQVLTMNSGATAPEWASQTLPMIPLVWTIPSFSTEAFEDNVFNGASLTFLQTNGYVSGYTSAANHYLYCTHAKRFKELGPVLGNSGSFSKVIYQFAFATNNQQAPTATDARYFIGFHQDLTNAVNTMDVSRATHHIGIYYTINGSVITCYCSSGNGTTTATSVTTFHGGIITAVHTKGVDVQFYRNGVLLATHTTNLPSFLSTHGAGFGMTQQATGEVYLHFSHAAMIAYL